MNKTLLEQFADAEKRVELKELVWLIYKDPELVLQAITALKPILNDAQQRACFIHSVNCCNLCWPIP